MKKKIDILHTRSFIAAVVICAVFVAVFVFIYLPAARSVSKIKSELGATEAKIAAIESSIDNAGPGGEGIRFLKEKAALLEFKFPRKEEETLKLISDLAQKANVEITSMQPSPKELLLDGAGQKQEIENKVCYKMNVGMALRCSYRELVRYLESFDGGLPALIVINRLEIKKSSIGLMKLDVSLNFNLYLLL